MLKILFCLYDWPSKIGGPNVWALRLLPELKRNGIAVEVAALCHCPAGDEHKTEFVSLLMKEGIKVHARPYPRYTIDAVYWLLTIAEECQPHVFIANCVVPAFYAGRYLRQQQRPSIIVLHSDDAFHHDIIALGRKDASFLPSAFVAVSEKLQKFAVQALDSSVKVPVIPCGVPIPAEPAAQAGDFVLLYAGRFVIEAKQIMEVTRAFADAAAAVPGLRAVLCGDGPERANMSELLRKLPGGERVQLIGPLDPSGVQELMLGTSCIVLLSDYEGLPIALMEGMACGLVPIVTQMRSGIAELIQDGYNGMVVPDRGPSFLSVVKELYRDKALRCRLAENARKTIIERYSDQAGVSGWLTLLADLEKDGTKPLKPFKAPRWIALPPVVGALAREDRRLSAYQSARRLAGSIFRDLGIHRR
jgi:colanic acid/amylovoran biosynthesis glycosyltransferase